MSDILRVNQSQSKILYRILRLQGSNKKSGVSGYMLSKSKNPIANTTFIDNIGELHKNGLVDQHKVSSKTTKYKRNSKKPREKHLYRVSVLGFFALLKSSESTKTNHLINLENLKFGLPKIIKHWNEIITATENIKWKKESKSLPLIIRTLQFSLKQIELTKHEFHKKYYIAKITIPFGVFKPTISYEVEYLDFANRVKKDNERALKKYLKGKDEETKKVLTEFDMYYYLRQIEDDLIQKIQFLFYYNMTRLCHDTQFIDQILHPNFEQRHFLGDEYRDRLEKWQEQLSKYLYPAIKKIRKKDKQLDDIFNKNLEEVSRQFEKPYFLEHLS